MKTLWTIFCFIPGLPPFWHQNQTVHAGHAGSLPARQENQVIVLSMGGVNTRGCVLVKYMKYIFFLKLVQNQMLDLGLFFKLIHFTEIMIELICVQGAYVYCMYRHSEIQLMLGTGSVQMEVFI